MNTMRSMVWSKKQLFSKKPLDYYGNLSYNKLLVKERGLYYEYLKTNS